MPLHDWTHVPPGLFHHFHQDWSIEIARTLNRGVLPSSLSALVEQRAAAFEPDVLAIETGAGNDKPDWSGGANVATLDPPATRVMRRSEQAVYVDKANRIVIRHHLGRVVAVIEIVSPGNKDSDSRFRKFVDKTFEFLRHDVHVLIIDLFPPSSRDPYGIHQVIWSDLDGEQPFDLPSDRNRVLVSYRMGENGAAYIEPIAVGDPLPDMPIFLDAYHHVKVPLESTYQTAWQASPAALRNMIEQTTES